MADDAWINTGALAGAACAGGIISSTAARSTAYVPVPLAIALSSRRASFAAACGLAFLCPFVTTMFRRLTSRPRSNGKKLRGSTGSSAKFGIPEHFA